VTSSAPGPAPTPSSQLWTEIEALAYVLSRIEWYERHRRTARIAAVLHDVALLATGAATTLAAALDARPVITASLAAVSFVLAGSTKVFRWRENWASRSVAWTSMTAAVNHYRLLPPDQRDAAATARLIATADRIVAAETRNWANVSHGESLGDDD
jgi:uncharacterized protein DUF4231